MKIKEIDEERIIFDNGNTITYWHEADCYEHNYADFSILNPNNIYWDTDWDENLEFKFEKGMGFKFGQSGKGWIFIPCYSVQNGYYTDKICIDYNGQNVLVGACKCIYEE